ncbi:FAD:protein FMN transferase [Enterococcus sp. AZ194]|uniref:FAD:protein FMN transferase n=1 Tax=Enterococcus sp. AZ194 TaxID=2774629 RepID=UPI003F265FA8
MKIAKRVLQLMGTVIQLQIEHETPELLLDESEERLIDYEKRFSANNPDSELMSVAHQAGIQPVKVDMELFELAFIGAEQSKIPTSFLNVAIGPLVQEWRVGFSDAKLPDEEKIHSLLKRIDPEKIEFDQINQTIFLREKGMSIDLGGLAKGYFADKIIAYCRQMKAKSALIDLGGNVLTFGPAPNHSDGKWRVGIQNPFLPRGNYVTVLKTANQSVVTSGVYERQMEWQGKKYHHIFDSQTGYPLQTDLASLTIVSEKSLTGEIWTTRLFGKTAKEALNEINQTSEIEGIVMTVEGEIAFSRGMTAMIEGQVK